MTHGPMTSRSSRDSERSSAESTAPIGIECAGLRRRYGRLEALAGLDLVVEPGSAVGLVGRNGSGKSTLFRAILGVERPHGGEVRVLPAPLAREAFLARIGFVPDQLSVYDWMTVDSALRYSASLQPRFDHVWCDEMVEALSLDRRKAVRSLSRGMQARLAFVLGTAHRPGLLLLDEPLLGADAVSHDVLLSTIARLRVETGCSILIASHALGDLARICDRLAFIDGGRIVENIATDELVAGTKRVVLRPEPAGFVPPPETVHIARKDGALVVTVRSFTRELAERMRRLAPGGHVDVIDLTIAEACADRMRAQEVSS